MAISKEKKEQIVAELKDMLSRSKVTVISDYRGLRPVQMAELRNKLRPLNSRFLVAKNTLILRSLEEIGLPKPEDMLLGPTALSLCFGDVSQPLKAMVEFAKATGIFTIKGGLLGERVIDAQEIRVLSTLPGLEVVQAQTLAGLQSPMSGFVSLLDNVLRGLLYALDAHAEQLGEAVA